MKIVPCAALGSGLERPLLDTTFPCNNTLAFHKYSRHSRKPTRSGTVSRHRHIQQRLDAVASEKEQSILPWIEQAQNSRKTWLKDHSLQALRSAAEHFQHPVFPCALIAGDIVILDLLSKLDYLKTGKVQVAFIDTFHLFEETHDYLDRLEEKYGFKAVKFHAKGFADKEAYRAKHGSDLYLVDIDEYDKICKVEPFNRALVETEADVMINGRRQDHGFERAHIQVFEEGKPVKCNPLAWWTFQDCFEYLDDQKIEKHPLHDQGYPSVGDVHSTVPVPKEKWFEYAGERSGRFQGLTNKDGSVKTECGIHVEGEDSKTGLSNVRK